MNWTSTILEPYRHVGDKPADEFFQKVFEQGQLQTLNEIFKALAKNKHNNITSLLKDKTLISEFESYMQETSTLPAWADHSKMQRASKLFKLYNPRILMILLCKSIPTCYSCAKGAKVLNVTGRIETHDGSINSITRRLMETAQFIYNILPDHRLQSDGVGIQSIQKVRLMHASIRSYAANMHWDFEKYDVPINQEDLAGTLLSFSSLILEGLEQTGIKIKDEDKDAYMHFWKVVGHLMGVQDDLLVDSYASGSALMKGIINHQQAPSEDGRKLTASCIAFMQHMLKAKMWEKEPARMIRFFVGDETADVLGVENIKPKHWEAKLLERLFNEQESHIGLIGRMLRGTAYLMSHELVNALKATHNKAKESLFEIPASLSDFKSKIPFPAIPEIEHIDEAIHYQKLLTDHFQEENNPLGYFAAIYWLVTRKVRDGIKEGKFKLPEMMEKVDVGFANRYFAAINAYNSGQKATGPWQLTFDAAERNNLIVNQHVFVACNAHIGFDLGITVAEEFTPQTVLSFKEDFLMMNTLFMGLYTQMNFDIHHISWEFAAVMDVMKNDYVKVENLFMTIARDKAWTNVLSLSLEGDNLPKAISQLEKEAVNFGKSIISPDPIFENIISKIAKGESGTVADRISVMEHGDHIMDLQ